MSDSGPLTTEYLSRFVAKEARLLDEGDHASWLSLFADACSYWVPGRTGADDPRLEVNIVFDDRKRLEDRLVRLDQTEAHSQSPPTTTLRVVGLPEWELGSVWDAGWEFPGKGDTSLSCRVPMVIAVFRHDECSQVFARSTYYLAGTENQHEILAKKVELLGLEGSLGNLSMIL